MTRPLIQGHTSRSRVTRINTEHVESWDVLNLVKSIFSPFLSPPSVCMDPRIAHNETIYTPRTGNGVHKRSILVLHAAGNCSGKLGMKQLNRSFQVLRKPSHFITCRWCEWQAGEQAEEQRTLETEVSKPAMTQNISRKKKILAARISVQRNKDTSTPKILLRQELSVMPVKPLRVTFSPYAKTFKSKVKPRIKL